MTVSTMTKPITWAAEVSHVREVSLLGSADLGFWTDRLTEYELRPAATDGKAQVLIITGALRFWGLAFREISFSVLVDGQGGESGAFLVHSFNSQRLLAFCERTFFSTPYSHGQVSVSCLLPAFVELAFGGATAFRAAMGVGAEDAARAPSSEGEDGWDGPVFLPSDQRGGRRPGKVFFARVSGLTRTYPFDPATDALTINPSVGGGEVMQAMLDSNFVAKEWILREDALHAKSKTYATTTVFPSGTES